MKLSNEQLNKIIQALCTCISTIAAIILVSACTMSMSIQKNNTSSGQSVNQSTRVDSAQINLPNVR
nr:MAG: hypothetical protein [Microvirus sp.]